jgi:hypothetical protein
VTTAEKYVAAAYAVLLVALLLYVAIISLKLARFDRELAELESLARARVEEDRVEEPVRG